jgi:hypothetical protein
VAVASGAAADPAAPKCGNGQPGTTSCATVSTTTSVTKNYNGASTTTTNTTSMHISCADGQMPKSDTVNGQPRMTCVPIH